MGQSIQQLFKEMRHIKPQALHFYRLYIFLSKLPPPGCAGDNVIGTGGVLKVTGRWQCFAYYSNAVCQMKINKYACLSQWSSKNFYHVPADRGVIQHANQAKSQKCNTSFFQMTNDCRKHSKQKLIQSRQLVTCFQIRPGVTISPTLGTRSPLAAEMFRGQEGMAWNSLSWWLTDLSIFCFSGFLLKM